MGANTATMPRDQARDWTTRVEVGPPIMRAASQGSIGDRFGASVAIGPGILVVGSPFDDTSAGSDSGSATVFTGGSLASLSERATLLPTAGAAQGAGSAVALNDDSIAVGAPLATVGGRSQQGRAYLYEIDELLTPLVLPSRTLENVVGAQGDQFGAPIVLRPGQLLIGVPGDDDDVGGTTSLNEGRVDPYVLDRVFAGGFE